MAQRDRRIHPALSGGLIRGPGVFRWSGCAAQVLPDWGRCPPNPRSILTRKKAARRGDGAIGSPFRWRQAPGFGKRGVVALFARADMPYAEPENRRPVP